MNFVKLDPLAYEIFNNIEEVCFMMKPIEILNRESTQCRIF